MPAGDHLAPIVGMTARTFRRMRDHATTTVAGRTAVSFDAQNVPPAPGPAALAGDVSPADPSAVPRSAPLLVAGIPMRHRETERVVT